MVPKCIEIDFDKKAALRWQMTMMKVPLMIYLRVVQLKIVFNLIYHHLLDDAREVNEAMKIQS